MNKELDVNPQINISKHNQYIFHQLKLSI